MKKVHLMSDVDGVQSQQADKAMFSSANVSDLNEEAAQATAGAMIRNARVAQGMEIAKLATLLKVPVWKLKALEDDQFDRLLDSVFTRALASSVCRTLKLDPVPVLQRLPAITAFKVITQNRGINTSFRERSGGHGASAWFHISRPAILLGIAFLLSALVLVFLPVIQEEISIIRHEVVSAQPESKLFESVAIVAPTEPVLAANAVLSANTLNLIKQPLLPNGVGSFASTPTDISTTPVVLPLVNAVGDSANATIIFNAKGESWVKVTDAKGQVVLGRTLQSGESASASGAMPLAAVVGRADVTQVLVRGQSFGLDGVTKNNVARFEVN